MARVAHLGESLGKRQLYRLYLQVVAARAFALRQLEFFQDVQRHQRNNALSVRRYLPDVVAAVIHAYRLDPLGSERGEIFGAQPAVMLLREAVYRLREFPRIEGGGARLRNLFQRARLRLAAPDLPRSGRFALRREALEEVRELAAVEILGKTGEGLFPPRLTVGETGKPLRA